MHSPERSLSGATAAHPGLDPRWLTLIVTTIGSFMTILDSTIVNIALPSILRDFGADLDNGQLVLTVYLLALAVVVPVSGFLAERVGMKRLYMLTLFFFTAGSALCGLSWNVQSLIFFRVLQGVGGGMMQPLGMAIVFSMITPIERGRFMAMLGLPMLLAPILGPTVGGYLVEYSNWRMIFLINLPIGVLNLALAAALLKETPIRKDLRLDTWGFALGMLAFPGVLLGISLGEHNGWTSPAVLGLFAVGGASLVAWVRVELRHPEPLLQVRLFANPMFTLGMVLNLVLQFSLFGLQYLMPLFLQTAHRLGAAETGLVLLPGGVASFVSMNFSGRVYNRVGPRVLATAGLAILLVTTAALSRIDEHTGIAPIMALATSRGLAMGLCMMPVQTLVYNAVAQKDMTRATALTNVAFRIYGSMSTAILTTVLTVSLSRHGAPEGSSITRGTAPLPLMARAFDDAFAIMAAATIVGMVMAFFLRDRVVEEFRRGGSHAIQKREESLASAADG